MWYPRKTLTFCRNYYGSSVYVKFHNKEYFGKLLKISDKNMQNGYTITIKVKDQTGTNHIVSDLIEYIKVDISEYTNRKFNYSKESILDKTNSDIVFNIGTFLKNDYFYL